MIKNILKRTLLFLALLLLSFFLPWQATALIIIAVTFIVPVPIEYIFVLVGLFGLGIFTFLWIILVGAGVIIRDKTRIKSSYSF